MQGFRVVSNSYATQVIYLVFSQYTHDTLGKCVYQENMSNKKDKYVHYEKALHFVTLSHKNVAHNCIVVVALCGKVWCSTVQCTTDVLCSGSLYFQ